MKNKKTLQESKKYLWDNVDGEKGRGKGVIISKWKRIIRFMTVTVALYQYFCDRSLSFHFSDRFNFFSFHTGVAIGCLVGIAYHGFTVLVE